MKKDFGSPVPKVKVKKIESENRFICPFYYILSICFLSLDFIILY